MRCTLLSQLPKSQLSPSRIGSKTVYSRSQKSEVRSQKSEVRSQTLALI
ncbi:MAG: hypothetical protein F6K55_26725 [Moorea sp. SIO4A3]|nr:hypothetical protein [Moorena sp. SIO4A3]